MDDSAQATASHSTTAHGLSTLAPTLCRPATVFVLPLFAFLLICLAETAGIYLNNGGTFVFCLDDAYIHMALAESLLHGHYGINPGEFAAPSSSILWPVLIAPLMALPDPAPAILALNILIAAATLWIVARILRLSFVDAEFDPRHYLTLAVVSILLLLVTNMIGLVFIGMEHTLQVFCAAALLLGMIEHGRSGRAPGWLLAVIVLGPLIRYENLALSLPALVCLFLMGHRLRAGVALAVLIALVGGFSIFLHSRGLGILPSSILCKTAAREPGLVGIVEQFDSNLHSPFGAAFIFPLLFLASRFIHPQLSKSDRSLAAIAVAGIAGHMAFGHLDWYRRYEVYALLFTLLSLVHLFRGALAANLRRIGGARFVLVLVAGICLLGMRYLDPVGNVPVASNNIYEQQYQMRRFIDEYWKRPVGVNDLGYPSYRNDRMVLDFFGLGSTRALHLRFNSDDPQWMDRLAAEHDVRLVMIYPDWFDDLPENWITLGSLVLSGPSVTTARRKVWFYATDEAAAAEARPLLADFARTLPGRATFVVDSNSER
jgi:hypothetical protein